MVLVVHFFVLTGGETILVGYGGVFSTLALKVAFFGRHGVDLFFVISGFLITGILIESKERRDYLWNFWVRRILRIMPVYYLGLALVFLVVPAIFPNDERLRTPFTSQIWFWTYLSNIPTSFARFSLTIGDRVNVTHLWSLAIEEQFYLFWPFIIRYAKNLVGCCVLLIVVAVASRIACAEFGQKQAIYYFTLTRVDALGLGALLCVLWKNPKRRESMLRFAPRLGVPICVATLVMMLVPRSLSNWFIEGFSYLTYGLFFALILLWMISQNDEKIPWVIHNRFFQALGSYSYGLYLWHGLLFKQFPIWINFDSITALTHSKLAGMLVNGTLCFLISLAAAMISYHAFEIHFLRLKGRFAPTTEKA